MTSFLSQLTRFPFLCRFWPWNELSRLQNQCHSHWEFGEMCLSYLNQVQSPVYHLRVGDRLYLVGVDYCKEVMYVPNPRVNFTVKGFDA